LAINEPSFRLFALMIVDFNVTQANTTRSVPRDEKDENVSYCLNINNPQVFNLKKKQDLFILGKKRVTLQNEFSTLANVFFSKKKIQSKNALRVIRLLFFFIIQMRQR
jgi:hypothetical protein